MQEIVIVREPISFEMLAQLAAAKHMNNPSRFYFANLLADVTRCVSASLSGNDARYLGSLARARRTLGALRSAHNPECYEEGLLLVRALIFAREDKTLEVFQEYVDKMGSMLYA